MCLQTKGKGDSETGPIEAHANVYYQQLHNTKSWTKDMGGPEIGPIEEILNVPDEQLRNMSCRPTGKEDLGTEAIAACASLHS